MTETTELGLHWQKLLHYQIIDEIGQGGMSVVLRAKDTKLDREVAVKVLHPAFSSKREYRQRFVREAKTIAQLEHPHILQIFDYSGEDTQTDLFLVTELIAGQTLKEFAQEYRLWEIPELGLLVIWEIAQALEHAHSRGVIHRDIKPENIMVRRDGVLKLMDFGIAQFEGAQSLTVSGALVGSPAHMPPEVLEGHPATIQSDIYSLTTVLYWLMTGQLPFQAQSAAASLRAIVAGQYQAPDHVTSRVFGSFCDVIKHGMNLDPMTRFETAKAFAEKIEEVLLERGFAPNSNLLRQILAQPEIEIPILKNSLRGIYLDAARQDLGLGHTAVALAKLSRVLADFPEDEQAQEMLVKAQGGGRRQRFLKPVGGVVLAAVVGILAIYYWPSQLVEKTSTQMDMREVEQIQTEAPDVKIPLPPLVKGEKKKVVLRTRKVGVSVVPFADIYVDGVLVQSNASHAIVDLLEGRHVLTFKHRYAATQERTIELKGDDKATPVIAVRLDRPKPAQLIIYSNVDADIAVGSAYKGTASASINRPILLSLPDRTQSYDMEIVATKEGYRPFIAKKRFIAGETTSLTLKLQPASSN